MAGRGNSTPRGRGRGNKTDVSRITRQNKFAALAENENDTQTVCSACDTSLPDGGKSLQCERCMAWNCLYCASITTTEYFLYTRTRFGRYYHGKDIAKAKDKYEDSGHTIIEPVEFDKVEITAIPVALDNYAYIVMDTESNTCVVIDVGDDEAVLGFLDKMNCTPAAVLTTHKHWDHSAGNAGMKRRFESLKIYGGHGDHVPDCTQTVRDKEQIKFGGLNFTVHQVPGHTIGHVVYLLEGEPLGAPDCLFSGDHLFLGGCGRMFEAPALTMLKSLDSVCRLKPDTLIWPGHEYAVDNLEFACHIDPENEVAKTKYEWAQQQRKKRLKTCPSTIEEELQYNPFLRTEQAGILNSLCTETGKDEEEIQFTAPDDDIRARVLKELRERKDNFKYIQ